MQISRRDALIGASAAAAVAGVPGVTLARDPVIGLSRQLRASRKAWFDAMDVFEEAEHRVGYNDMMFDGFVAVETSRGYHTWSAGGIRLAAEDGKITPELRDAALAGIKKRQRDGEAGRVRLGIEPLWQEREHWIAQYWDLRARVLDTPAATPHGVLAKFRGCYHDGEITDTRAGGDPDDDLPKEFAASIYRDLERLAREVRS